MYIYRMMRFSLKKKKYIYIYIQDVPKLTLDILKADSLANLKTIFPQRKCRGRSLFFAYS